MLAGKMPSAHKKRQTHSWHTACNNKSKTGTEAGQRRHAMSTKEQRAFNRLLSALVYAEFAREDPLNGQDWVLMIRDTLQSTTIQHFPLLYNAVLAELADISA